MRVEHLLAFIGSLVVVLWLLGTIGMGDFVLKYSLFGEITCTER